MRNPKPAAGKATPTLSLKIGRLFEAHATGWAVLAVPVVLVLLAGLALAAGLPGA